MSTRTERHEVVVIGAGQAGLAAGYHLATRGIDLAILEGRQRIGDVWRERYDSLKLYSPAKYDALPGLPFPLPPHAFPTGRQMGEYLEVYAGHHHLPVRTGAPVARMRRDEVTGEYVVEARDVTMAARAVIVATGAFQRPHVPDLAPELDPAIRQVHAADYRNPAQLADGPVLVVGVSHSGADIAHEIATAGHPTLLSGRIHGQLPFSVDSRRGRVAWPVLRFLAWNLLTLRTPIGRKMAPKVRLGGGPLLRVRRDDLDRAGITRFEARTVGVRDGKPALADGRVLDVANVVWCTGFRPDYRWIELPVFGVDGWPLAARGVVASQPGLYFLGVPFQYSFTSMLVLGAGRDAKHVVDHLAARLGERPRDVPAPAGSAAT